MKRPLRVAISGCGGITPWTFEQLALNPSLFDVVAVQDPSAPARQQVGDRFGVATRHADFEALVGEDVDFVILNGPNDVHRPQVELAAARGIPCLVQKPLASSLDEAATMLGAARAAGLPIGVVMMERGDPLNWAVRDLVHRGFIGEPTLIEGTFAHDLYLRTPPADDDWRRDPHRVGGGAFGQLAVHSVDLAEWLCELDVTEVAALTAGGNTVLHDETMVAAVRFGPNTAGTFGASWAAQARQLAVHGTDGSVVLNPYNIVLRGRFALDGPLLPYSSPGTEVRFTRSGLEPALAPERARVEVHACFARSLLGEDDNPCDGDDALHAMHVLDGLSRSVATGTSASVPPIKRRSRRRYPAGS